MRGTGTLLRLSLRLDRVRLTIWVLVLGVLPAITAANYKNLYPDQASLKSIGDVVGSVALKALVGPIFGPEPTLGTLTTWKIGLTEVILAAVMGIFMVVRHTRNEEETGRAELLSAGVIGRYAVLTAAMLEMLIATAAITVLITLLAIGLGFPAGGSLALGLMVGLSGLAFAAVAAVAAQIPQGARAASGIAIGVLGGLYLLRAIGDTGPTALSWISPIGWALFLKPYADEAWWVVGLFAALIVVLMAVAYALAARRDVGLGLVADRPAAAAGSPSLRSSFSLAWQLHRGPLIGWSTGMAVAGLVFGASGQPIGDIESFSGNQQAVDYLSRIGGAGAMVDMYFGTAMVILAITCAAYTISSTVRMRSEESAGLLEPLLATRVGRIRWAASHLVFSFGGTALLLAVVGVFSGLGYGAMIGDTGTQVGRLVAATMVQLPATWLLAGVGVLLFGLVPRLTAGVSWAALVVCLLVLLLGAALGLNQWVMDISPFTHTPRLPVTVPQGGAFTAIPLLWLTLVAVLLTWVGLSRFRGRDLSITA